MAARLSAVVLAAGSSRRLGRSKLLLDLDGKPVVWRVVAAAAEARPTEIVVVVGPERRSELGAALAGQPVQLVVNERSAEGMGGSIAKAVEAVAERSAGLILLQGDQPLVTAGMLRSLAGAWAGGGRVFAASSYAGVIGPPVVFDRRLFGELAALAGDRGARSVIEGHPGEGAFVDFPAELAADIDDEEDYRRILGLWRSR
jgi:molybdenum cofactor cytidylyltransferase